MRRLLGRLGGYLPAAIAFALPTVFLPAAEDSFILPRASLVITGACLGVGIGLLTPGRPGLGRLRWPLYAGVAAALLAFLFSVSWPLSFAGSYTRYESLPIRLSYLGLLAAAVWLLRDRRARTWTVAAFVFGTAVACLEALLQWYDHVPFRPDGNLGNANLLGALIAMAFPLAVAQGLRRSQLMGAWWFAAAVLVGGLVVSTSRSGGLGALAGCLAMLVFTLKGRAALVAGVTAAAAVGAALVVIVASPLHLLNDDPGPLRIHLWQDGLGLVSARPVTGWGQDATGLTFGGYLTSDWSPGVTFDRIHSGPLDVAATQGILGLTAIALILVILVRGAWAARFVSGAAPLTGACIAYTVWVLFNFDWAPATGAFWLLAGTTWSAVRESELQPTKSDAAMMRTPGPGPWRSSLAVTLALAAIVLGVLPVLADTWYLRGRADLSVVVDPLQARYHWGLGQALVNQGSVARGVEELRKAADYGETEPDLYVQLGNAEVQLGQLTNARGDYRRALRIDPYYGPARQRLTAIGG